MNKINFDFKNITAVITGGAQGFGLDIAKRFLKSGAKVVIWDIDPKMIEKAINDGKYFFSGILNFQKGININNTNPILRDDIRIGGTESFKTNLVNGNALP